MVRAARPLAQLPLSELSGRLTYGLGGFLVRAALAHNRVKRMAVAVLLFLPLARGLGIFHC